MSDKDWIKSLTTEAETYRIQGLLKEAKEKYLELLDFVKKRPQFSNNHSLIEAIIKKVDDVEKEITEIDQLDETPDLSEEAQNLIKRVFSFSDNQDISAIEGAVALAKFGQYERAMEEFDRLIHDGVRVNTEANIEQLTRKYTVLIRDLRDSYKDIREHSIQLLRYAKELTESYEKIKEEESLRHKMSRYVGQNLLDKLIHSKDDMLFDNERKEVTVLFADIRSFAAISERMSAEEVVSMLNEYFTTMVDVIFRNNGILDKFVGDELMAVFGLIPGVNTPYYDAVKSAIDMQEAAEKLMWARGLLRKETFEIGIGINTGDAIVGNVGSSNRMDYTVIGDCVNTASRLQSVARGGEIIIGEITYKHTKDQFNIKKKGEITLKNKRKPVSCYQVLNVRLPSH